jgi:hypothetical protein
MSNSHLSHTRTARKVWQELTCRRTGRPLTRCITSPSASRCRTPLQDLPYRCGWMSGCGRTACDRRRAAGGRCDANGVYSMLHIYRGPADASPRPRLGSSSDGGITMHGAAERHGRYRNDWRPVKQAAPYWLSTGMQRRCCGGQRVRRSA